MRWDDAVILVLLADLPLAPELIAVILDRRALQRFQRHDHELVRGLGLEIGGELFELLAGGRIENVGPVDHAAGQFGKGQRLRQRRR